MKNFILLIFGIISINFCYGQKNFKVLIKENEKSVFLIQCFNIRNEIVSTGTGFFIEPSGVAFTNVHVIKDAYRAKIKTIDGRFYEVEKIIDYNSSLDIAKIKIKNTNGFNFPSVKIALKKGEKGEEVFAIGNPDGLESSVSTGIISSIRMIPNYGECYQITAPISPGSSGGALFNMNGEVIGMTSFGQTDGNRLNQNLNFAINIKNSKYLTKNLDLSLEKAYKKIEYENFIPSYMHFQLSGDYKSAIKVCTEQLKIKSTNGLAYHFRATSLMSVNELSLAELDFNKSLIYNLATNIKEWDYIGLGRIYRKSGQFEKSKENYLNALEINDKNAITYCNLAILAYDWQGSESDMVEPSYMMALKLDPSSCAFGYKIMAERYLKNKDYEKAISFFTMSIQAEIDKKLSINEYYNRGTCYFQIKKYASAVEDFKICVNMSTNDIQSYLWMGMAYYEQGKKLDACNSFKKANEINEGGNKDEKVKYEIAEYLKKYCR